MSEICNGGRALKTGKGGERKKSQTFQTHPEQSGVKQWYPTPGAGQDNAEEVEAGTPGSCKDPLLWPNLNEAGSRPLAPLSVPAESNLSKNPVK